MNINEILRTAAAPLSLSCSSTACSTTRSASILRGYKNVTFNEPFFTGHFRNDRSCPA
ncbi:MAG: hypothetical protein MZV65_16950 [Chromatiales bacterium]|nr:hypothetical protein [Chromatiales bacterium]